MLHCYKRITGLHLNLFLSVYWRIFSHIGEWRTGRNRTAHPIRISTSEMRPDLDDLRRKVQGSVSFNTIEICIRSGPARKGFEVHETLRCAHSGAETVSLYGRFWIGEHTGNCWCLCRCDVHLNFHLFTDAAMFQRKTHGYSQATVSRVIAEVSDVICNRREESIFWPDEEQER